jgi:glycosyltransferase involved in cell wall biosynthesis
MAMTAGEGALRILHVFSRMNRGGAELRTLDLMRHIDRERYQFEFCCTSGLAGELDHEAIELGGRIHPIRFDLSFSRRFRKLLRDRRFDAVHSHLHYLSGYILRLAAREGVPGRIAHFRSTHDGHGNNLRRLLQRRLMRHWLDRSATRILGVSGASLQDAWGDGWQRDARCEVIYNGVDAFRFTAIPDPEGVRREFGIPSGSALCIHIGRMDEAKNHVRLLQIFERVLRLRGDCYLILAGGGESGIEQSARTTAARLGIAERVVFAGTRSDVPRLLGAAELMIFPSSREGLPGAILEASAAGTPVLATNLPCILEISERLTEIRCLSLSEPDEIWAAAAIGMIAQRGAAGAALKRFELTQFSMRNCTRAFEAVYRGSGPYPLEALDR